LQRDTKIKTKSILSWVIYWYLFNCKSWNFIVVVLSLKKIVTFNFWMLGYYHLYFCGKRNGLFLMLFVKLNVVNRLELIIFIWRFHKITSTLWRVCCNLAYVFWQVFFIVIRKWNDVNALAKKFSGDNFYTLFIDCWNSRFCYCFATICFAIIIKLVSLKCTFDLWTSILVKLVHWVPFNFGDVLLGSML